LSGPKLIIRPVTLQTAVLDGHLVKDMSGQDAVNSNSVLFFHPADHIAILHHLVSRRLGWFYCQWLRSCNLETR
jgi:hypothetical protein